MALEFILVWGLAATASMTTLMEGAQLLGVSRISLPFLFGTFITPNRSHAMIIGFVLYCLGGLLFAFLYTLAFISIGYGSWWLGALIGLVAQTLFGTILGAAFSMVWEGTPGVI
jgi:hypothetical protein